MKGGSRALATLAIFTSLLVAVPLSARAQIRTAPIATSATRDASLRALANRLDLPLVEETVTVFSKQLRRTLPPYFVDAIGQQANLGPQWKRGNPWFDEALRQVDAALADEEARNGPLLKLEHSDLLYAVNIPWTQDDIAFIASTIDTELGRQAQRAIDARAAQQAIHTLKRRVAVGPGGAGIAEAFTELDARAASQFGDASLMLLPLRATDPERTKRLQRLLESVTTAPSDAIGERLTQRLGERLMDAAAAQLPNLLSNLAGFRGSPR